MTWRPTIPRCVVVSYVLRCWLSAWHVARTADIRFGFVYIVSCRDLWCHQGYNKFIAKQKEDADLADEPHIFPKPGFTAKTTYSPPREQPLRVFINICHHVAVRGAYTRAVLCCIVLCLLCCACCVVLCVPVIAPRHQSHTLIGLLAHPIGRRTFVAIRQVRPR